MHKLSQLIANMVCHNTIIINNVTLMVNLFIHYTAESNFSPSFPCAIENDSVPSFPCAVKNNSFPSFRVHLKITTSRLFFICMTKAALIHFSFNIKKSANSSLHGERAPTAFISILLNLSSIATAFQLSPYYALIMEANSSFAPLMAVSPPTTHT